MWWKNPLIVLCKNAPNNFNKCQFTHNLHMLLLKCRPREQGTVWSSSTGDLFFYIFNIGCLIIFLSLVLSSVYRFCIPKSLFLPLCYSNLILLMSIHSNCLPCRFVSSSLTDCDNNSCWLTSYAADRNMVLRKRRHKGLSFLRNLTHRQEGQRQKQRQRSSLLFGGQNLFNSLPH